SSSISIFAVGALDMNTGEPAPDAALPTLDRVLTDGTKRRSEGTSLGVPVKCHQDQSGRTLRPGPPNGCVLARALLHDQDNVAPMTRAPAALSLRRPRKASWSGQSMPAGVRTSAKFCGAPESRSRCRRAGIVADTQKDRARGA